MQYARKMSVSPAYAVQKTLTGKEITFGFWGFLVFFFFKFISKEDLRHCKSKVMRLLRHARSLPAVSCAAAVRAGLCSDSSHSKR